MMAKTMFRVLLLVTALSVSTPSLAEAVWIDVRTSVEYALDNIEGDGRISTGDIVQEVSRLYPDRSTEIYLYCGSGTRAGHALEALLKAGYTNVSNAGGIDDAREVRGLE